MHQLWIQVMLMGCFAASALAATVTLRERQQLEIATQLEASLPRVQAQLWPPGWPQTLAWHIPTLSGTLVLGEAPPACEPLPEWPGVCLSPQSAHPLPEDTDLVIQLAMARLQNILPLPDPQPEPLGTPISPQGWALQELEQRLLADALEQSGSQSQQSWQQALSVRKMRLSNSPEQDRWEQSLLHREGLPWALALEWLENLPELATREDLRTSERRQELIQQLRTPLEAPFAVPERLRWMGAAHTLLLGRFEAQWQQNLQQRTPLIALATRSAGPPVALSPAARTWLTQRSQQLQAVFRPTESAFASPQDFWAAPGRKLCLEVATGDLGLEPRGLSAYSGGIWLTSPGSHLAVNTPTGPLRFSGVWLITAQPQGWQVCGQLPPSLMAAWPPTDLGQVHWFWSPP